MKSKRTPRAESGMATFAIVGIVLTVVVAGGGAAWFATDGFGSNAPKQQVASSNTSSSSKADTDTKDADETDNSDDEQPAKTPMKDALKSGKAITCTHTAEGQKFTSYWKSSELFRFDMDSPAGEVHTLAIDRVFHVWGANLPSGIKMPAMSGEDMPGMPSISPEFIEDLPGNANADCSPYTGSDSIFQLPKNVSFRDMSGMSNIPGQSDS